jgi:hypothetical protein
MIPSDADTLRKAKGSLDGLPVGRSHTTSAQPCTQEDQSRLERAVGSASDAHETVLVDTRVIGTNVDSKARSRMLVYQSSRYSQQKRARRKEQVRT